MSLEPIRALVSQELEAVDSLILDKVKSEIQLIGDLSNHIFQSGGKRLRPIMVLLACKACQYEGKELIKLAALIEFFHTATLLHDDVVDESSLRRGQETANLIWGSKASILVGDYLFIQYLQLMIEVGNQPIMKMLGDVSFQVSRGEIHQLWKKNTETPSEADYFEIIRCKTALMFAAAAGIGPLIANQKQPVCTNLYRYGLHVGNAFQLIDDALDYCSDAKTLGKNIGDDLADGKATLPLLYALKKANPKQQALIQDSLKQGRIEALPEILEAIEETKAIQYTQDCAKVEVDKALSCLEALPESVYKKALQDLALFAIKRISTSKCNEPDIPKLLGNDSF